MAVQGDGLGRRGAPLAPPRRLLLLLVRDGRGPRGRLRRPRVRRRERPHRAVPSPWRLRAVHLRGQEQVRPRPAAGRAQGRGKRGRIDGRNETRTSSMRYISHNPQLRRRASLFRFPSCSRFTALCAPRTVVQRLETGAREHHGGAVADIIFHLSLRREVSSAHTRTVACDSRSGGSFRLTVMVLLLLHFRT